MKKPTFVVWDKGKPVTTNSKEEVNRINKRIKIIGRILKEMGYPDGYTKYEKYVNEMARTDFNKYMTFLDKVSEEAKKEGC